MPPKTTKKISDKNTIQLAVLSVKNKAATCRDLATGERVVFRMTTKRGPVPGEILTLSKWEKIPRRGSMEVSGTVKDLRLETEVLGLTPLRLHPAGEWNPAEQYWGEEGEPIEEWAKPIITHGPRPQFEMEQVLPGAGDLEDPMCRLWTWRNRGIATKRSAS